MKLVPNNNQLVLYLLNIVPPPIIPRTPVKNHFKWQFQVVKGKHIYID